MQILYTIVADSAQVTPEGKFIVIGGGIDNLAAPNFPALTPNLSLLVRLGLEPTEADQEHKMRIELRAPIGVNLLPPDTGKTFTPKWEHPEIDDLPITYLFVFNFPGLIFSAPGKYRFRLFVDEAHLGDVPVHVIRRQPEQ